ncbi:MAG TPA: hypothetical protein PKV43_10190 [Armatimonadota bacterium]|nr:hypothetical protein [Armatimonadota bacterium]
MSGIYQLRKCWTGAIVIIFHHASAITLSGMNQEQIGSVWYGSLIGR